MLCSIFEKLTTKPRFLNWSKNESGGIALMAGISFPILVLAAGGALDIQRAVNAKQIMQGSLDAAALSVARNYIETGQIDQANLHSVLEANASQIGRLTIQDSSAWASDNLSITASATAEVDMYFLNIFGQNAQQISVSSEVTYGQYPPTEVGLVIDISGSLVIRGVHDDLADALDVFLETIHPAGEENMGDLFIGLVPFSGAVNVGGDKQSWLKPYNASAFLPDVWSGCTMSRGDGEDITDTPPTGNDRFDPFLWTSSPDVNTWAGRDVSDFVDIGLKEDFYSQSELGPNAGCAQEMLSLTNKRSDVEAAIEEYSRRAQGSIGTFLSQGMAWGHRVLSTRWQGLWGGPTPPTAPSPNARKYLIFLTDGEPLWNNFTSPTEHYSPRGWSTENRLDLDDPGSQSAFQAAETERFLLACEEAKSNGIIVFTIGYAMSEARAETLRGCATDDAHFLGNPSASEIRDTLGDIANQIVWERALRISG